MNTHHKVTQQQWNAAQKLQSQLGASDGLVAAALGCGETTVRTHRHKVGWTTRSTTDGGMTAPMSIENGAAGLAAIDLFGEDAAVVLDDAALRRALDRLMTLIVNETARVGMSALDPLAVKRLEVMSNMARSFEKLLELKAKLAPPGEAAGGAAETARVLKEMDRRVDELAAIRAREIIDHHCIGGTCGARQFADEVARSAVGG